MESKNINLERTALIKGDLKFTNFGQIIKSTLFKKLVKTFIDELTVKKSYLLQTLEPFKNGKGEFNETAFIDFVYLLNINALDEIIQSGYFDIQFTYEEYSQLFLGFLEGFYNYWRSIQRFMIKTDEYSPDENTKRSKAYSLASNNDAFKKMVLDLYRNIHFNVTGKSVSIYRQLPSGAQVAFLTDKFEFDRGVKSKNDSLYKVPYVWEAIFEPPVIFYTQSSKRDGIFPVKDKRILQKFYLDCDEWFAIPVKVGRLLSIVYVQKEFLALGAGLFNLFEMATPEEFTKQKPDAVVFFGLDGALFEDDEKLGFVAKEDDVYYGLLPDTAEIDYFGYMKKMMLTLHNVIQIEKKAMPVHGAFAKIRVGGRKSANIMLIGDSGAGKSETLEAINKLPKELACDFDILIDDMGSLHFSKEGELMAVGTEIGAFVRLDDLQPGYAYSTMDRSIFMNPNIVNARVIVPQMSYEEISKSTRVDFVFYINNYEEISETTPPIELFNDLDEAYAVFSEGKRMAKGTTGEVGITTTYFANPFGAVQLKDEHEKIAKKTFKKMQETGVKIGMIRTQLGIPGYEQNGPFQAAQALIQFIDMLNKSE
ncbi:hypothetical protein FXB42_14045 [Acetobacterium wieringae]|uniref:Phosphoenolpyruvate carboxykinase n=1 Tax=Acetobacterium wieringae TaxID=52694 RepID=A0A5D0WIJ3_9FIRM|nr:hypothetical protein [Acetobacterium wieringae]TYC84096.1 hypothetical protein FXB42_14045 [Acetobacterium wieringae]